MMRRRVIGLVAVCAGFALVTSTASAGQIDVSAFGQFGWGPDDVRNTSGTDLVGAQTNAPKPGAPGGNDAAIAAQAAIVTGPAGSTYGGAVKFAGTASGSGKTNVSTINTSAGFGALDSSFIAKYEMYKDHTGAGSTPAFKLGIQSTDWANSQAGFTAIRSGESAWDLVLVHVPTVVNHTWTTVNVDWDTGTWTLFKQAGNSYFTIPPALANPFSQTLQAWSTDATFGSLLFGAGSKVSSIQFGLGSGQPNAIGYVDYLQTNLLNGGDVVNFAAAPLPAAVWAGLTLIGGVGGMRGLRRVRRAGN